MLDLHGFGNQLLIGAAVTLLVAAAALIVGILIGLLGASAKLSGIRPLKWAGETYTTLVRGIPDLLIIFLIYFGGTVALSKLLGRYVEVDPFSAGTAALGFVFGAYATEIFRGAIQAVPKAQFEAAKALGLSTVTAFFLVVMPQAIRYALPPLGNQSIVLLKQTSLVSVVGLEELMRKSSIASGATNEPFRFYLCAAIIYLIFTSSMTAMLRIAEWRAERGLVRG